MDIFGFVQCDLVVPEELKLKLVNSPPIFKNTQVARKDIGDYMKDYANENEMLKHPQRMLISDAGNWNIYNSSVQLLFGVWLAVPQNLPPTSGPDLKFAKRVARV